MSESSPGAGRRRAAPPSSPAAIIAAALALLDRDGADALSMRRLGAELGVEAMSIYRHVADRGALLDAVADRSPPRSSPSGPRRLARRAAALAGELRAVARRHPDAFTLVGVRVLATAGALEPVEDALTSLRRGGFTPARAISAYRLVLATRAATRSPRSPASPSRSRRGRRFRWSARSAAGWRASRAS